MPMLAGVPASLASVAVGAAQGALDAYVEATRGRVTRGAVAGALNRMGEFATVQLRVAEAAASVDAARTILLRDLRAVLAQLRAGGAVTVADRIAARRGHAFAAKLALAAIEALNAATGANGLSIDQPVQRAWRDVNAVARHISLNWDAVGTMYGQHVLGLEPKGQY
jgi:alkylation response protein AidB-like acyl-CoA dehydrogenase